MIDVTIAFSFGFAIGVLAIVTWALHVSEKENEMKGGDCPDDIE